MSGTVLHWASPMSVTSDFCASRTSGAPLVGALCGGALERASPRPGRATPTRVHPREGRPVPNVYSGLVRASLYRALTPGACWDFSVRGVRDGRRVPTRRGRLDSEPRGPSPVRGPHQGIRGADEAADHRAVAHHHRSGDVPGRSGCARSVARPRNHHRRIHLRGRCECAQHVHRPRHRRVDGPYVAATAGHRNGEPARVPGLRDHPRGRLHRLVRSAGQLALRGPQPRRAALLRRRLHDAAEAPDLAEHRLGRDHAAACRSSSAGRR